MSKRQPKFKITFKAKKDEVQEKTTPIKLNGDTVGHIYHPGFDTHAPGKFHITLLQRVIGNPHPKTLKPLFNSESEAMEYILDNLQEIHAKMPLYLENPPKEKRKKSIKFGEDWINEL